VAFPSLCDEPQEAEFEHQRQQQPEEPNRPPAEKAIPTNNPTAAAAAAAAATTIATMSSKLVSLARVVFLSKAAAARSAPAAIAGPLRRFLVGDDDVDVDVDGNEEQQQQQQRTEEESLDERIAAASANDVDDGEAIPAASPGIFAAMAARATTAVAGEAPVDGPMARRELREFQASYYRRALAATSSPSPLDHHDDAPDLSIPVGDEHLYLAQ